MKNILKRPLPDPEPFYPNKEPRLELPTDPRVADTVAKNTEEPAPTQAPAPTTRPATANTGSASDKRDVVAATQPAIEDPAHLMDEERKFVKNALSSFDAQSQKLSEMFFDLQAVNRQFGIPIDTPEIVVVGMQSDGKSTFIEGLLGFQFNIVETNIGTRRPLIIQMVNDPDAIDPVCHFVADDGSSEIEDQPVPVNQLHGEIAARTDKVAGKSKQIVSDAPIVLRVRYHRCANLTIYDTPGFRLAGLEALRKDIEDMVMKLIAPPHRVIVCLEQSTVEWANSNSRQFVQRVDPNLERTVLVCTKFDNRVKELRDAESANGYLAAEGLPGHIKPFFVSLPVQRNLSVPHRFQQAIVERHMSDYQCLADIEFDKKTYGPQVGFVRSRLHIERLLKERLKLAVIPTIKTIRQYIGQSEIDMKEIDRLLDVKDPKVCHQNFLNFAFEYAALFRDTVTHDELYPLVASSSSSQTLFGNGRVRKIWDSMKLAAEKLEKPSYSDAVIINQHRTRESIEAVLTYLLQDWSNRTLPALQRDAIQMINDHLLASIDESWAKLSVDDVTKPFRSLRNCPGIKTALLDTVANFVRILLENAKQNGAQQFTDVVMGCGAFMAVVLPSLEHDSNPEVLVETVNTQLQIRSDYVAANYAAQVSGLLTHNVLRPIADGRFDKAISSFIHSQTEESVVSMMDSDLGKLQETKNRLTEQVNMLRSRLQRFASWEIAL